MSYLVSVLSVTSTHTPWASSSYCLFAFTSRSEHSSFWPVSCPCFASERSWRSTANAPTNSNVLCCVSVSSAVSLFCQPSVSWVASSMSTTFLMTGWSSGIATCARSSRYRVPISGPTVMNRGRFSRFLCSNMFAQCWSALRPVCGCTRVKRLSAGECSSNDYRERAQGREDRRMFSPMPPSDVRSARRLSSDEMKEASLENDTFQAERRPQNAAPSTTNWY